MNKIMIGIWAKTHEDACEIFDAMQKELCAMHNVVSNCLRCNFTIEGENYKLRIFPDCSAKYGVMGRSFDYMYCFPDTAEYKTRLKQNGVFKQYALYGDIIDIIERLDDIRFGVCKDCMFVNQDCENPFTHCYNCEPQTPKSEFKRKLGTQLEWHHSTIPLKEMLVTFNGTKTANQECYI